VTVVPILQPRKSISHAVHLSEIQINVILFMSRMLFLAVRLRLYCHCINTVLSDIENMNSSRQCAETRMQSEFDPRPRGTRVAVALRLYMSHHNCEPTNSPSAGRSRVCTPAVCNLRQIWRTLIVLRTVLKFVAIGQAMGDWKSCRLPSSKMRLWV
jgi:hypothetical protein